MDYWISLEEFVYFRMKVENCKDINEAKRKAKKMIDSGEYKKWIADNGDDGIEIKGFCDEHGEEVDYGENYFFWDDFYNEDDFGIEKVNAVYTGGNIWLFHGQLEDGNYFLTDDFGATLILDANPSNLDESTYQEWQDEHLVRELESEEREQFCSEMLNILETYPYGSEEKGGIIDSEIDAYKDFMTGKGGYED